MVAEVKGEDLAPPLAAKLRARGTAAQAGSTYRIATVSYVTGAFARAQLGQVASRRPIGLLRDALVAHAKEHGYTRAG